MKAVILAGGLQSTISNAQEGIPKPMIELGGKPLLWHIMKHFSNHGINEFIICGGYKIELIKEYFLDFYIYESDITVDLQNNTVHIHKKKTEDWKVTIVDTGLNTSTGERVRNIESYITEDNFIVSYGDCLSDIDISEMIQVHNTSGKIATIALAKPAGRKTLYPIDEAGLIPMDVDKYVKEMNAWVNANCYILKKDVFCYLQENYDLEQQLLRDLTKKGALSVYKHDAYWTAVETKRDLVEAERLWDMKQAPWIKCER